MENSEQVIDGSEFKPTDSPPNKKDRIVCGVIICIFLAISALCAGLPSPEPEGLPMDYFTGSYPSLNSGDTAWVIVASAMVLFMTPGVAFFYGGAVGHKNVIGTMFQSFVTMGLVSVLWVWVGFSLAFGKDANGSGIMGYPKTYYLYANVGALPDESLAAGIPLTVFSMFQLMFAIITPALIVGSLAERVDFHAWMIFVVFWHLLVYCPLAHIVWHPEGALRKWGYIDFAGGIPVEMASGYSALAASIFLGPRKHDKRPPANIPYIMLGTAIFWFGWIGFNAGSALAANHLSCQAFVNTNTAGAAAMMMWICLDIFMGKATSSVGACNGIVVGLVAITPGCGYVTTGASLVIGAVSTVICYYVGYFMKELSGIDDTLDVFAVHGVGGTCGVIFTGIFCSLKVNPAGFDGLVYGEGITLAKHIAAILVMIPCTMIVTYLCCVLTNSIVPLRISEEAEHLGLDLSLHDESLHHAPNVPQNLPSGDIELAKLYATVKNGNDGESNN